MRHRLLRLLGLATGGLAGIFVLRDRLRSRRARLDVYFDDGSFVTFVEGSQQADRLVPLAREVVAAALPS